MTTFHESQPQSRRAARQSEREVSAEQAEFTGQQPDAPQVYSPDEGAWGDEQSAAESVQGASKGRRAAAPAGPPSLQSESVTSVPVISVPVTLEPGTPELLADPAQQRSPVPSYDGPSFTNRAIAPVVSTPESDDVAPTQAIEQVDRPGYRVRDYSPDARRAVAPGSATSTPNVISAIPGTFPPPGTGPSNPSAPSDIFRPAAPRPQFYVPESALADTIVPGMSRAGSDDITPEELAGAPVAIENFIPEHTMTRRELRALEAQQAAAVAEAVTPVPMLPEFSPDGSLTGAAAAVFVETDFSDDKALDSRTAGPELELVSTPESQIPEAQIPVDEAAAPVEPATQDVAPGSIDEAVADDAAAVDEVRFPEPALSPFDALFLAPSAHPAPRAEAQAPVEAVGAEAVAVEHVGVEPVAPAAAAYPAPLVDPVATTAPAPSDGPVLAEALAEFDSLTQERASNRDGSSDTSASPNWIPPFGHWSAQDEVDEDAPGESNISRTVGSGMSTTSALVLPAIPDGADIRGPLTMTGEIKLTGSIDLPRTLSSTGQSDRFDGESMDALFDLSDAEVISTDSSPVRAIRAVSTHTSGHGVTHTHKPKGTRALTGLLIAASSLAVAVAGLLVAAFAFNVF
ncbi:MAG: hypothetical protein H7226_13905 [Salinibacterium sp.]|nr:hypothetical protein [Salinibacterium sp.]